MSESPSSCAAKACGAWDGERLAKCETEVTTHAAPRKKENTIVNKTDYIWANTTLWCEINEGVVYYHHTDHLGTTEVITDSNGKIVWHADYEAFGSVMNERGEENFTPNYTGKFFDESSGLYY